MTNTYTIDQLKLYLHDTTVKNYFDATWKMKPDEILMIVDSYLTKQRDYFRDYYHSRKHNITVTDKLRENNRNWYQKNKKQIAALQRCRYANDPEYNQHCRRYQAVYAQKQRNVTSNERNVGRPRKYNIIQC